MTSTKEKEVPKGNVSAKEKEPSKEKVATTS